MSFMVLCIHVTLRHKVSPENFMYCSLVTVMVNFIVRGLLCDAYTKEHEAHYVKLNNHRLGRLSMDESDLMKSIGGVKRGKWVRASYSGLL